MKVGGLVRDDDVHGAKKTSRTVLLTRVGIDVRMVIVFMMRL
jgi:hypothetical protein